MIATTTVTSLVSWANVTNIAGFNIFTSGGVISSSQMNQNFDLINQKIDNIGAVTYVGTYDASVGVDPGSASAGDYYIISSGGIINSTNYVVGDWIVYDGTVWEQVQQGGLKVNKAGDTMTGDLLLDTQLKLKGGANYVTVRANAATANYTLSFPTSAGTSGYVLQTDGAGVLSWVNPSSISAGTSTVSSSSITDGSIVDADINASANIAQSKIANLTADLANKEIFISPGTTSQYYRGDKTWSTLATDVVNSVLTSFTVGVGTKPAVLSTDSVVGAFGKIQKTLNDINAETPLAPLAGDSGKWLKAVGANSSAWSYLTFGDIISSLGFTPINKNGDTISTGTIAFNTLGTLSIGYYPTNLTDATSKSYVDDQVANAANQWSQSSGNIYRSTGNIGLGTTTPTMKLDIHTPASDGLQISANSGHSVMKINSFSSNANDGALLHLYKASGISGSPGPVPASSLLGQIRFGGYNGSMFTNAATIEGWTNSAYSGSSTEAMLKFTTTASGSVVPTERMRIMSDGKVGIGTSSPAYELHVLGQVAGSSAFMNASDKRLKENIHTLENSLEKIHQLRGVRFHFTEDAQKTYHNSSREELGVIAQEVKKVFPQAVSKDSSGIYSVAYSMLISPLIEAVKELDKKVSVENKALKEENTAIKNYLCEKDPHAPFCSN